MALATLFTVPLSAQWLHVPTPGVPRTADGKPNLGAPAPPAVDGHPDLSGVWMPNTRYLQDLAADLKPGEVPYQPWAAQVTQERANGARQRRSAAHCVPGCRSSSSPYLRIVQLPRVTMILYEGFTTFRQIFTDGRELPKDPQPTWMGYSIGKWEGDTLVVDTVGINDKTWMDNAGRPHSDALHLIERYHRGSFGTLDVAITIDDPKAYTRPWTVNESPSRLILDQDLLEYVCTENNKDVEHLFGAGPK